MKGGGEGKRENVYHLGRGVGGHWVHQRGYASLSVLSSVLCCLGEKSRSLEISVSHKRRDWVGGQGTERRQNNTRQPQDSVSEQEGERAADMNKGQTELPPFVLATSSMLQGRVHLGQAKLSIPVYVF